MDQITEDCSVSEGPLECSSLFLTRGVCFNSECITEKFGCQLGICDENDEYSISYSSTGSGTRRQSGEVNLKISGCSAAFCASNSLVRCALRDKIGLCQKVDGSECQIVDNTNASI